MARSKRKPSARAKAEASSASEDLDELTSDDAAPDDADPADTTEDGAAEGSGTRRPAAAKDSSEDAGTTRSAGPGKEPAKRRRAAGGEVPEKAKDAARPRSQKKAAAEESQRSTRRRVAAEAPNPRWLAPAAVTMLLLGLVYLVAYYLSAGTLPLPIGDWNLAVGFGIMLVGGGMLMFWK